MEFDFEGENNFESPAATQQEFDDPLFREQSLEESLASLYKPPYTRPSQEQKPEPSLSEFNFDSSPEPETPPPAAPRFPENKSSLLSAYEEEPLTSIQSQDETSESKNKDIWPMLLLAIGGQLLTLALLLFFFSDNGVLTLQWNAKKWFVYALVSLPMIYFGLRALKPKDQYGEFSGDS